MGRLRLPRAQKKHKEGSRKVYPVVTLNDTHANGAQDFPANVIRSTKYTWYTFLPKLLFEQYRKVTTIYFTIIVIITLIPILTPVTPATSVPGLAFILIVAAIREAVEDLQRAKADKAVNTRVYQKIDPDSGKHTEVESHNIKVGDLIYIEGDQSIPADCVVLATALDDGLCYEETASLDGETNLKIRKAPFITSSMSEEEIGKISGTVECETPRHMLYSFKGTIQLNNGERAALDHGSLLLMSAIIRNTPWAIGVVVYAGPETKLSLNQKKPPSKFSQLDKRMNVIVWFLMGVLSCVSLGLAICGGIWEGVRADDTYVEEVQDSFGGAGFWGVRLFFSYFVLLSFMIPLSLVVSLEIIKVCQARLMEWDEKMAIDPNDIKETGMVVKTSNLNDELAQVEYVFSDKTGTLTENVMEFCRTSIMGVQYEDIGLKGNLGVVAKAGNGQESNDVEEFLHALALCHSVVTDTDDDGRIVYKAASPDEEALCDAARANGHEMVSRTTRTITIREHGEEKVYDVLAVMEFTSDRRRMSVVVRSPEGRVVMYSKGADSMMYSRLNDREDDIELKQKTLDDLDYFSAEGLRTLVVAKREMSDAEFAEFDGQFQDASNTIEGREEAVEEVCARWETNLELVGATAIEDKLQDRVPETIEYLLLAGIKVWVITGDKQATAINIGYSSRLLSPNMDVIKLNAESSEECYDLLRDYLDQYVDENGVCIGENLVALVVDGATLKYCINEHPDEFLALSQICHSVVCCRVTPIQKAKVVKLVKSAVKAVTLSVGDGANDVSMIQEANIGVGIFGKEGTQAARSADFAIRKFKHLQRLISVHGRWSLIRNGGMIQYSFYKNTAVFMCQVWFAFWSAFSAETLYDDFLMTLFNITITSLPPLVLGAGEKDLSDKIIERHPQVYNRTQQNNVFTYKTMAVWYAFALYHSLIFYYLTVAWWNNDIVFGNGQVAGLQYFGNAIYTVGILVVLCKFSIIVINWYWLTFWAVAISVLGFLFAFFIESQIVDPGTSLLSPFYDQYKQFNRLFGTPAFYFFLIVVTIVALVPDVMYSLLKRLYFPEDWEILQERYAIGRSEGKSVDEICRELDGYLPDEQEMAGSSSSSLDKGHRNYDRGENVEMKEMV
eukprot:TRINITY_DN16684_c0_g1_i1.p1 TRINITY_DN16684_c0_g1~~TRINITY_DN16684_c0_g1_i1.p1  ORF type:complete len:1126 (+),score=362.88 TRINITY_DN16684_c0_g1_i1:248-3625(+)